MSIRLCRELGVEPISSFLDRYKFDAVDGEDESTWYSAKEGAATFTALAKHISENPEDLADIDKEQLKTELDEACKLLGEAAHADTQFHLVVVIMVPGTEQLL